MQLKYWVGRARQIPPSTPDRHSVDLTLAEKDMSDSRKDIASLIDKIRKDLSLVDRIRPSAFESVVAEIVAQNKKLIDVQREAFRGVDYLAQYRDEFDKINSIAVDVKKAHRLVGIDAVKKLQDSVSSLEIDKSYLVTNSSFTEAAKRLASEYSNTIELIDRSSLRKLISTYEFNKAQFTNQLFERLNRLDLNTLADIEEPTPEQVEQLGDEESDLSETFRNSILAVHSLPLKLIAKILRSPHEIRDLTPRQFEEFVAETLNQLGFKDIILTPRSHDGGKDVIASHEINGIPLSFYFECKKYSEGNKIQLETLRALLGTMAHDARNVNKGVLVTTSTFTKGSREFILSEARLDGKDYDGILGWIDELKKRI